MILLTSACGSSSSFVNRNLIQKRAGRALSNQGSSANNFGDSLTHLSKFLSGNNTLFWFLCKKHLQTTFFSAVQASQRSVQPQTPTQRQKSAPKLNWQMRKQQISRELSSLVGVLGAIPGSSARAGHPSSLGARFWVQQESRAVFVCLPVLSITVFTIFSFSFHNSWLHSCLGVF